MRRLIKKLNRYDRIEYGYGELTVYLKEHSITETELSEVDQKIVNRLKSKFGRLGIEEIVIKPLDIH